MVVQERAEVNGRILMEWLALIREVMTMYLLEELNRMQRGSLCEIEIWEMGERLEMKLGLRASRIEIEVGCG